jgi:hypothetical protein
VIASTQMVMKWNELYDQVLAFMPKLRYGRNTGTLFFPLIYPMLTLHEKNWIAQRIRKHNKNQETYMIASEQHFPQSG